ncbi:hypothetical protein FD754_018424, partial [Muntiacus muntjak]
SLSGKEPTHWCRSHGRCGFDPWVRKIPWRRKWLPILVFLPGEPHRHRSLVGYNSICVPGFDPGLNMMTGITPINPMIPGLGLVPPPPPTEVAVVKEIIHCKSCTLFPQNPNLPPPSTRERPPGCKTVFVGGLPENATEEIIQEVFEQCGDITAIRKSKKNFCHIRFAEEFMVDKAIYLSGYRMRLGSSTDKKDSGRLHVDFAQARDDFYEWECKQRMRAREERHRRKLEEDRLRPPSPPPIMHYSEHEATLLAEKLKDDGKFSEAITVLLSWIERGEVNRRSANHFYSMVQSANSHVRRLMNEKATHEQEMEEAKENFKNALTGILTQCNEQLMGIRREEEMEMSDDENCDSPSKKMRVDESERLRENLALYALTNLRCQFKTLSQIPCIFCLENEPPNTYVSHVMSLIKLMSIRHRIPEVGVSCSKESPGPSSSSETFQLDTSPRGSPKVFVDFLFSHVMVTQKRTSFAKQSRLFLCFFLCILILLILPKEIKSMFIWGRFFSSLVISCAAVVLIS